MRKQFRRSASLFLLTLALMAQLIVPAFAASDTTWFVDVDQSSPWYEGVTYLAEQGITNGTGANCYSPDAPITVRQLVTMLCRAYGITEALETPDENFGAGCVQYGYTEGWLDMYAASEPDAQMCRGALYQAVFRAVGLEVYNYALYPDGVLLSGYENCLRVGKELGLCPEDTEALESVTRGEVAKLLLDVLTQELQVAAPPLATEFPIKNNAGASMNDYLMELQRVPDCILKEFQKRGWTYAVDYEYLNQYNETYNGSNYIGLANYGTKYIYVSQASATVHEFGHFLDRVLNFPAKHTALYESEKDTAGEVLRDYALTNKREYFADYFAFWIRYRNDAERMERLRAATPETYQYFTELEANNWGCLAG